MQQCEKVLTASHHLAVMTESASSGRSSKLTETLPGNGDAPCAIRELFGMKLQREYAKKWASLYIYVPLDADLTYISGKPLFETLPRFDYPRVGRP